MKFENKNKRDVLIIVKFPNIEKIKEIQKEYYDIADKVEPHIAVTFPFSSDISDEELYNKLCEIASKYKSFKIVCQGVYTPKDEPNYRFLRIVKNKDIIKNISDMKFVSPDTTLSMILSLLIEKMYAPIAISSAPKNVLKTAKIGVLPTFA